MPTNQSEQLAPAERSAVPVNASDFACIDFANTAFSDHLGGGADVDRIASNPWWRWFLDRYELQPTARAARPLDELVRLRRDLRRVLETWSRGAALSDRDVGALDMRMRGAPLRRRVSARDRGIELTTEPLRRDWSWVLASITASAIELMQTGDPKRLKVCTNPSCSWLFYDTTLNRSKRYCSATPCASLMRVRRFRERR